MNDHAVTYDYLLSLFKHLKGNKKITLTAGTEQIHFYVDNQNNLFLYEDDKPETNEYTEALLKLAVLQGMTKEGSIILRQVHAKTLTFGPSSIAIDFLYGATLSMKGIRGIESQVVKQMYPTPPECTEFHVLPSYGTIRDKISEAA